MSLWTELGFRDNPYSIKPIPPTAEGAELFVGRETELRRLMRSLQSSDTHPTVEGENGVGKTSLVQVATFLLSEAHRHGQTGQLLLPLDEPVQLGSTETIDEFRLKVYFRVARAFFEHGSYLRSSGYAAPRVNAIESWLTSPLFHGGGLTTPVGGGQRSRSANTSEGFTRDGFIATVNQWLRDCFPSPQAGAFVCVVDNLELLETSQAARAALEEMRDTLLQVPGLRWVLCGARGIVRTGASSPRLAGVLADPIDVGPMEPSAVSDVIPRRVKVYAIRNMGEPPQPPVDAAGFSHVYRILHANMRDALRHCQQFSFWADDQGEKVRKELRQPNTRFEYLEIWLTEQARQFADAARNITPRHWRFFDDLVASAGSCSPSDHERFGFRSAQGMRPSVRELEKANFVVANEGERDARRKTISVTSSGWLVHYHRSGYVQAPETAASGN